MDRLDFVFMQFCPPSQVAGYLVT